MSDISNDPIQDVENQIAILFSNGRRVVDKATKAVHPDLQPSGLFLLRMLAKRGPLRPSVIADRLEVDRSAVSRLISSVESLGLVTRLADPLDKRAYTVALTGEGQGRLDTTSAGPDGPLRRLLVKWEPEDIANLSRLLARLNDDAAAQEIGQERAST
jgi:DNA-binding MarR family transcriptional regulator